MSRPGTLFRLLAVVAAWLLYACGESPVAPPATSATTPFTAPAEAARDGETIESTGDAFTRDPLVRWALDRDDIDSDLDARIANAILELSDDRKEHRP